MLGLVFVSAPTVVAQDDGAAAADDAPAADEPAAESGNSKKRESWLGYTIEALGWTYSIVFLALSFTFVALFVMNLLQARRETVMPTEVIEGFEAHLTAKQFQEAYELASSDDSFLSKVLSAGLAKVSKGYDQAIEAMQEVGEDETMKLEHRLSYMSLIGTICPMVGLLGTVHGMIDAFQEIGKGGGTPDPSVLADKISMALATTFVGLFIAIPAIAAYNILRNRIDRLVLEVGMTGESLMSRFQTNKKPTA